MTLVQAELGGPAVVRPAGRSSSPVALLCDLGLLSPGDAARALVGNLSRAHPVFSVQCPDGRRLVVKTAAADRGADLGIEFLVYRLAVWCEPVRRALPVAVAVDEDRQALVLEELHPAGERGSLAEQGGWPPQLQPRATPARPAEWLAGISRRLGETLGALHRGTADLPLPPARSPLILLGLVGEYPAGGALGEALAELRTDERLVSAAGAWGRPSVGCLVNHDMKWDNVVVAEAGRIVLVDWELAGRGDPAWDLGCLLAEHLLRRTGPAAGLPGAAGQLLGGYAASAVLRPTAVPVLAERTVIAAGLRIAQLGLETVESLPTGADRPLEGLVALARAVLDERESLTREVAACLLS